jgi:hypothetical protein
MHSHPPHCLPIFDSWFALHFTVGYTFPGMIATLVTNKNSYKNIFWQLLCFPGKFSRCGNNKIGNFLSIKSKKIANFFLNKFQTLETAKLEKQKPC